MSMKPKLQLNTSINYVLRNGNDIEEGHPIAVVSDGVIYEGNKVAYKNASITTVSFFNAVRGFEDFKGVHYAITGTPTERASKWLMDVATAYRGNEYGRLRWVIKDYLSYADEVLTKGADIKSKKYPPAILSKGNIYEGNTVYKYGVTLEDIIEYNVSRGYEKYYGLENLKSIIKMLEQANQPLIG